MLKVLYLPIGSQLGTESAFQKYANTLVFDFLASKDPNGEFVRLANEFKPDLIHMQLQLTNNISPETLKRVKATLPNTIFTNWTGDIRSKPNTNFIKTSHCVDFSLLSNVGQIEMYKNSGCKNPMYWQIGYDPKLYFPKNKKLFKYDVSFIGTNYGKVFPDSVMRSSIAEKIKTTYRDRAGIFGGNYKRNLHIASCNMLETNEIYNDSVCVVSISNFNNVDHYFSDRMLMCLASGRPTIAFRFPGSQSYFADRGDFLVANSSDDIFNLIEECKSKPEWASNIGKNGHLKVLSEHTFESRILELFSITGLLSKI